MNPIQFLIGSTCIILSFILSFVLGMRWESHSIKNQLEEVGVAISRHGDHKKMKIIGTVQEYNK